MMSLGFAFTLLLTLQSVQLVATQDSDVWTGESTSSPLNSIPDEWKRKNGFTSPEEDLGGSSGSMTFSGDYEMYSGNQTVIAVTGQYNNNTNNTPSPQTTLGVSSDPTIINATSIQQNNTSSSITPDPYLDSSTTISSNVNLTETNTTLSSPKTSINTTTTTINTNTSTTTINTNTTTTTTNTNTTTTSSAVGFNFTQNSTTSGTFKVTSPPQLANYTQSPSENSTNTTIVTTTTMLNHTSIVLLNESSTASTTNMNTTGGSLRSRENIDRDLSSGIQQQTKSQAWGAILGIGVGVALVALVIYLIVKRRNHRDFSHRKLVADMPPDPVLRLDNSQPLDLKFDGFAYYNPGLQGDNIQMANFPQGHAR